MTTKNVTVMIRVPESLVPELKSWAEEEYLSVNKLVTRILAAAVKIKRGPSSQEMNYVIVNKGQRNL